MRGIARRDEAYEKLLGWIILKYILSFLIGCLVGFILCILVAFCIWRP